MTCLVEHAKKIAEQHLAKAIPRRWSHVPAVGAKAEKIGVILFDAKDVAVLAAAAWLHDVGYAPDLAATGFHPLDGARWLRKDGFDDRVTNLVAHHSCAHVEAAERGLATSWLASSPARTAQSRTRSGTAT